MKRISIVTATIGYGHNRVAQSCKEAMEEIMPGSHIEIIDILHERWFFQGVKRLYLGLIGKAPSFYSKAYYWSKQTGSVSSLFNLLCRKSLQRIAEICQPDAFLFTHPFAAASYRASLGVPAWAVLTEFNVHILWYNPQLFGYFVANLEVAQGLTRRGFSSERIYCTGIPITSKFNLEADSSIYEETLLPREKQIVLVMGGGLGLGALERVTYVLDRLNVPLQGIVLTGCNRMLERNLSFKLSRSSNEWHIIPFTNCVDVFMKKASFLISKAGAVTLSEAAACGLPTIIYRPLPGQEEDNARYVSEQGWACWAKNDRELKEIALSLLTDPAKRDGMSKLARARGNPGAAREMARILRQLLYSSYENLSISSVPDRAI